MNPSVDSDLGRLLQDGAWLRRFVATLVPAQDVDDLVQATALAALRQHGVVGKPRQWLRGIAANLARMRHRQRRRNEGALQHVRDAGNATPTADLVAGLEVQRAVSEALLALPEPTRTILVLRYQEGLDATAIAARVGLQEAAVRQRLHRGRELVKAKLQQRFGVEWQVCGAVLAFAGRPAEIAPPAAVAGSAKVAAALLLVAGLAGAGWAAVQRSEPAPPAQPAVASTAAGPTVVPLAPANAPANDRTLLAAGEQDPVTPAAAAPVTVRGRLVAAEDGSPLAGVELKPEFRWRDSIPKSELHEPAPVTTDGDGRFAVPCPPSAVSVWLWFLAEGRCRRWYEGSPPQAKDLGDIALARGGTVRGVLLDEAGRPMEGVRISLPVDGGFPFGGKFSFPSTTAADGSFAFRELVPPGPLELGCETRGVELVEVAATIVAGKTPNLALLRGRRLPAIRGVVFGPDGNPVPGVDLEAVDPHGTEFQSACGNGRSADDGSFEVFRTVDREIEVQLRTAVFAVHELTGEPPLCAWGTSGLRVEVRPLIPVRLRVVEAGTNRPVERFGAWTSRHRGRAELRTGGTDVAFHEDGRFTFPGLAAGTRIQLWADDAGLAPVSLLVEEWQRHTATVTVPLARLLPFAVTLVDVRGAPVATALQVVDPCGATQPEPCNDPRTGTSCPPSVAILVSSATTDTTGGATVLAHRDGRDLVVAIQRNGRLVWLPLTLPAPGQPVRLVVPD